MRAYDSCDNFMVGDSIICMNDKSSFNITKNKTYEALFIYEADCPKTKGQALYVQIADDGDQICSYEAERFKSIQTYREDQLSKILD